jgi:hypothetical protein
MRTISQLKRDRQLLRCWTNRFEGHMCHAGKTLEHILCLSIEFRAFAARVACAGAMEQSASGSTEQLLAHQGHETCQVQVCQKSYNHKYQQLRAAELTGLPRNTL